jgi:hypothetical protein
VRQSGVQLDSVSPGNYYDPLHAGADLQDATATDGHPYCRIQDNDCAAL